MASIKETDFDDLPITRDVQNLSFQKILELRLTRRALLKSVTIGSACIGVGATLNAKVDKNTEFNFEEIKHGLDDQLYLPKSYSAKIILSWGDAIVPEQDSFDPHVQSAESQVKRFGYNNDFVAYLPISKKEKASSHGLLIVNHEYASSSLMHPGSPRPSNLSNQQIDTEMAAHGLSVVEVQKHNGNWEPNLESTFNRRITPKTRMQFSGPASSHKRLVTAFSKNGIQALGTFGNCAGCITPWGTVLTAEENIQAYFMGDAKKTNEYENYKRFGLRGTKSAYSFWGKFHSHWDLNQHPQAGLHAGWIVEIDPLDPNFVPIKRTALGRCKHEGCDVQINKDGRAVVYMGDDQAFEYIYRFVSKDKYIDGDKIRNMTLLDNGELSVAEFKDTGEIVWHPLQWGHGPHTKDNGFESQADVVLDMRKAADLVGATPMDRPEEIKVNPVNGNVFAVLTNNIKRNPLQTEAANPRAVNRHGHILELIPPEQDHSAKEYKWEVFILAGDPNNKIDNAHYHADLSVNGWFSSPDNCSFDTDGNIWIATDGFNRSGSADGIWVSTTLGVNRALTKQFLRAPAGAEVCSPCFTPDYKTMFCSIQHPGGGSSFDQPSTRWPDFNESMPPRPSVIAIQHKDDKRLLS